MFSNLQKVTLFDYLCNKMIKAAKTTAEREKIMRKKFNEMPRIKNPEAPGFELHIVQVYSDKYKQGRAIVNACWTVDEFKEWLSNQSKKF